MGSKKHPDHISASEPDDTAATKPVALTNDPVDEAPENQTVAETAQAESSSSKDTADQAQVSAETKLPLNSVKAETHSKSKKQLTDSVERFRQWRSPSWLKLAGFMTGGLALIALLLGGAFGQYFKGKALPNVYVAGVNSGAKSPATLKSQLGKQMKGLRLTIKAGPKTLQPKLTEIGYSVDIDKTVAQAMDAKRERGLPGRLSFWQRTNVPASLTLNKNLLSQFIDANTQDLSTPAQDAQLQFNARTASFVITAAADGSGPDAAQVQRSLQATADNLSSQTIEVPITKRPPAINQTMLEPLLGPANQLINRRVTLTGLARVYVATKADIAAWITPTPQKDNSLKLVVDPAKVQSYVDVVGKRISSAPQDTKILKDEITGTEVVLQAGQDGTELADKANLANTITAGLSANQDVTQEMTIQTAAHKTVNMNAYDKWIEVDLSEQRTTVYERSTPIRVFSVATGMKGYETPTGEFAIWHKNRKQTMQGGSKADGSYYSIPNVEWVSYFYKDYALHGAWWRKQFGYPASHGCVNMSNAEAEWLYGWAPIGTKVIVHQ